MHNGHRQRFYHFALHPCVDDTWLVKCCTTTLVISFEDVTLTSNNLPHWDGPIWLMVSKITDFSFLGSWLRDNHSACQGIFVTVESDIILRSLKLNYIQELQRLCLMYSLQKGLVLTQTGVYPYMDRPRFLPELANCFDLFMLNVSALDSYNFSMYFIDYLQRVGVSSSKIVVPFIRQAIIDGVRKNLGGFCYFEKTPMHYCDAHAKLCL